MGKLFAIIAASCIYAIAGTGSSSELRVSESENGDSVRLTSNTVLVAQMTCAISGGYHWQCDGDVPSLLSDVSAKPDADHKREYVTVKHAEGSGSQVRDIKAHVLRFIGHDTGWCVLNLIECRAWEKNASPAKKFTLYVHVDAPFSGIYEAPKFTLEKASLPLPKGRGASAATLPAKFDWVDSGIVTTPKDQGQTGDCWDFSACGVWESQITRFARSPGDPEVDLSEQFVNSCNPWDMNSNNGGNFPYPMAIDYIASDYGQDSAGVVYETDCPFDINNPDGVSINNSLPHHEKLTVWGYCDYIEDSTNPNNNNHTVTTDEMKSCIYRFGPIGACVDAESNWDNYNGGVVSTGSSNTFNSTNHIIMVTGWDDNNNCFNVRNSWGPDFGENGYIRIAYNTAGIQTCAAWISYNDTSATPVVLSAPRSACKPVLMAKNGLIKWSLQSAGKVGIGVYSLDGREVTSVREAFYPAGAHSLTIGHLAKGIYIVKLVVNGIVSGAIKDIILQ